MTKIDSNLFVAQLTQESQDLIVIYASEYLDSLRATEQEKEATIENILCDRLWNLEDMDNYQSLYSELLKTEEL